MTENTMTTDLYGRGWAETEPGLWRSTDGAYTIHRTTLPGPRQATSVIYTLRHIHPASAAAWPGTIGVTIGTCGPSYSLTDAQQETARHARGRAAHAGNDRVLSELPALAADMFFWPVSEGLTRGALTVTAGGGGLTARVTGMSCQSADPAPAGTWEPGTYAEIDITAIPGLWRAVTAARVRAAARQVTRRAPR